MYTGGVLIKRFDGFRRLCRHAAAEFGQPLSILDTDMQLANRTLAALGGPPAPPQVRGRFSNDGLPLLLLFLLTGEWECRVGLLGSHEPVSARLKGLVHLLGHAVYPLLTGQPPLSFQEVVREMGPSGTTLRPCILYEDTNGEPERFSLTGARGQLRVGAEGGPYTLAVLLGAAPGPAPLSARTELLHPAVLILP